MAVRPGIVDEILDLLAQGHVLSSLLAGASQLHRSDASSTRILRG
jgi:hypothetical protein